MAKIQEQLSLPNEENYPALKRELTLAWRAMAQLVNNLFTYYIQSAMPTIPDNTTSLWKDSVNNKYYIVANFGGVIKKIELT